MRILIVALPLALALAAPEAHAHAFLDHALPAVGSTVPHSPETVTLSFTQPLEPAFSTVSITDHAGNRVDEATKVDPQDPMVLHVTVKTLPAGSYRVEWRVLSIDTHVTTGHFSFEVAGP